MNNSTPSEDQEKASFDQSKRAENVLDHVLKSELEELTEGAKERVPEIAVQKAREAEQVLQRDTGRQKSRVLIVSSNQKILDETNMTHQLYSHLSEYFDEVHVMVLVERAGSDAYERKGDALWFYTVHAKHWWQLPFRAREAAVDTLTFNGSVRPDVIIGIDPFEAGWAARLIAKEFKRPVQMHIETDFTTKAFIEHSPSNKWRRRLASYLIKRTESIRTNGEALKLVIEKNFKNVKDLSALPHFYNFTGFRNAVSDTDVHTLYPQYSFVILAFGALTADSHLHDMFSALRQMLGNPRIGLIVVGDGPAKHLFTEKSKLLGIEKNVVFLKKTDETHSYIKTADMVVQTDVTAESEEVVLQAAAAGTPLVMYETDMRKDLFKDGTSAFLCEPGDILCISKKLAKFINNSTLRIQFARNTTDLVESRLEEDPDAYYRTFRDTIEVVVLKQ